MSGNGIWVFYFIQGEEGESYSSMNALKISTSSQELRLCDFLRSLPKLGESEAKYHCRFRVPDPLYEYTWLDISKPNATLPTYDDMICAKLLDLNKISCKNGTRLKKKTIATNRPVKSANFPNKSGARHNSNERNENERNNFGKFSNYDPTPEKNVDLSKHKSSPIISQSQNNSFHRQNQSEYKIRSCQAPNARGSPPPLPPPRNVSSTNSNDLMDFDSFYEESSTSEAVRSKRRDSKARTSSENDRSFDAALGNNTKKIIEENGKSAYVNACIEERAMKIENDMNRAVQVKKDRDAALIKEQDDFETAKAKHDAKLTTWAEDHGRKRNLRTLLSTMHNVLWEGTRWKPIGIGDILDSSKVKLSYRKAMLVVHPDKCADQSNENKFIAKRIFEALNESWKDFSLAEKSHW